ncbi:MAG: SelB C-terminal domain-containing protein, partial [Candidatus Aminicenantales bacterium]
VFTLRGFGTVVAGTILSGGVSRGDRIEIFPEGMIARVRNVQVHHRKVERSGVGLRTALNIPDVRREDLRRGQCAGEPGSLSPTFRMDGRLHLLKSAGKPLKNRARIRFHTGTAEIMARVVLLDKETVHPGESGLVQFVLEAPGVALPRDRFVIRTFSPLMTIGGGVILDASPPKHKRQDGRSAETLTRIESGLKGFVEQVVSEAGLKPCQFSRIRTRTGRSAEAVHEALCALVEEGRIVQIPGFRESAYIHREGMERLKMDILSDVRDYLQKNPHRPAMPYEELRSWALRRTESAVLKKILDHLVDTQRLESRGADVALPGFRARLDPREKEMMGRIERTFQASGLTPPLEEDVRKSLGIPPRVFGNLMYSLFESQRLVRLNDRVVYHRDFLEKARRTVIAYLEQRATIAVAELRDLLKISRKYATAILEYFDRVGLTKREEDVHILRR